LSSAYSRVEGQFLRAQDRLAEARQHLGEARLLLRSYRLPDTGTTIPLLEVLDEILAFVDEQTGALRNDLVQRAVADLVVAGGRGASEA
jgi:hypothetical protein